MKGKTMLFRLVKLMSGLLILVLIANSVTTSALPTARASSIVQSISVSNPSALAVNPANNKVYVTSETNNTLTVYNENSDTNTTFTVDARPRRVAVNPRNGRVYITHPVNGQVTVLDANTNAVLKKVEAVGNPYNVDLISVDATTNDVYFAANYFDYSVPGNTVVNRMATDYSMDGFIPNNTNISDYYDGLSVGPNGSSIYLGFPCVSTFCSQIQVYNTGGEFITRYIGLSDPHSIVADTVRKRVYLSSVVENKIVLIDDTTNSIIKEIVGHGYKYADYSPSNNHYYGLKGNTLDIMDGDTFEILNSIQVGTSPFALAINPNNNFIYVLDGNNVNSFHDPEDTLPACPAGLTLDFSKWFKDHAGRVTKDIFTLRKNIPGLSDLELGNFPANLKIEGLGELGFDGSLICPTASFQLHADGSLDLSLNNGKKVTITPTTIKDLLNKWEISGSIDSTIGPDDLGIHVRTGDKPIIWPPEFFTADTFAEAETKYLSIDLVNLNTQLRVGITGTLKVNWPKLASLLILTLIVAVVYAAPVIEAIIVSSLNGLGLQITYGMAISMVALLVRSLYEKYKTLSYAPPSIASRGSGARNQATLERLQISDEVLQVLRKYFDDTFIDNATLSLLISNQTRAKRGEDITVSGGGFTPGGKVLISLADGDARLGTEVTADVNGRISGAIQVPSNASGGSALITAVDADNLSSQIEAFILNPQASNTEKTYMGAVIVSVPYTVFIPDIKR